MRFEAKICKDKLGREITLRNAELDDAHELLPYLKTTAEETRNLMREPDECELSIDDEKAFIESYLDDERQLLLIAVVDGKHVGNCALMSQGELSRFKHRGRIGIALYQKYCGQGIGRLLLENVLDVAKKLGYEQVELEVMAGNKQAIALYESVGFINFGTLPKNMKYKDGTYTDAYFMVKQF